MSRFFENKLQDFVPGSPVNINKAQWKQLCEKVTGQIKSGIPPTLNNCDGGLYLGCAGIAFMFYRLLTNPIFSENKSLYMSEAEEYLSASIKYSSSKHNRDPGPSFILGPAGVYCISAILAHQKGDITNQQAFISKYADYSKECLKQDYLKDGSDELFVGRAGYLCGLYTLQKLTQNAVLSDVTIKALCNTILQSGRDYSKQRRLTVPLMYAYYKTEYLGAAHGLSAILQMLLRFSQYIDGPGMADIKQSVEFMLRIEQTNYNYAPSTDEISADGRPADHELVHWCHGAPGVVYLFAQAYKVWNDERYLQACQRCAELVWQKGLLKKGPGICHGIAGSGYVFLLLYRLTNDPKYLYRAEKFAEFLLTNEFQSGAKTPDSPYSLYEGWAGTLCFLSDLTEPDHATFPFFDVF